MTEQSYIRYESESPSSEVYFVKRAEVKRVRQFERERQ